MFFFLKKRTKKTFAPCGILKHPVSPGAKVFCGGGPPGHFFQKSDLFFFSSFLGSSNVQR
jgi:hypothetical protein